VSSIRGVRDTLNSSSLTPATHASPGIAHS
jgi:hypothetical protein